MLSKHVIRLLKESVGASNLILDKDELAVYTYDATPFVHGIPAAAVRPDSAETISAVLKLANTHNFTVVPRGSGTGLSGGSVPAGERDSVVMMLNHKNRILEIDTENMTALVEPGVITGKLQTEVEKSGLMYPPDPGSAKICTIGGNVAENAGGIRGLKYGVTRDYVMALEIVLPDGRQLYTGNKCIKDVSGYSLKDLFIGSEGTLGIFTQILLKLIPKPESSRTILAAFHVLDEASAVISGIFEQRIFPSMLEILDQTTLTCIEDYAGLGLPVDAAALLLIEVDGTEEETSKHAEAIHSLCKRHNAFRLELARDAEHAEELKAARRAALAALARAKPTTIMEDIAVPRSRLKTILEYIHTLSRESRIMVGTFGHAGDGNIHPTVLTDERDESEIKKAWEVWRSIMNKAVELGGTISGEHGIGTLKRDSLHDGIPQVNVDIMKSIKHTFDPNNILNPGKMFPSPQ